MWPAYFPVFVPVAVNLHIVVNYQMYSPEPVKAECLIENHRRNCLGFVDTAPQSGEAK